MTSRPLSSRTIKALMVIGVVVVGLAAAAPFLWSRLHPEAKATMPPPPRLFPAARLGLVSASTASAAERAGVAAAGWIAAHPQATDAEFSRWALAQTPAPPGAARRTQGLKVVESAVASRTPEEAQAALWLEKYGKKAVWKLYLKQAKPFIPAQEAARAKVALKAALALGATLTNEEKVRAKQRSPYEVDPRLAAINKAKFNGQTRYSYPSKHDVLGFAALVILDRVDPHRAAEFRWMADQVSYSRLAGGGHYPADLDAGAYLGTLIGRYEIARAGLG